MEGNSLFTTTEASGYDAAMDQPSRELEPAALTVSNTTEPAALTVSSTTALAEPAALTEPAVLTVSSATALAEPASRTVALASGRSIELTESDAGERIEIRSARGELMLSMRLTDEGPVLSLSGVSLEIAASKKLALACDTLEIKAATDASIEVGGNLRERVAGHVKREAAGTSATIAREVRVEAFPGGVTVKANDDVAITGERVRLNSDDPPMPLTWEEHRARRAQAAAEPTPEQALVAALLGKPDPAEP